MDTDAKKTILIADDDRTTREFLGTVARLLGHVTLEADNGKDALAIATEHRPDLILLDILMPGIDGYTDLRLLRQNWRTRAIPVVVISGHADSEDAQRCLMAGANHFVVKPATAPQVREVINRFLSTGEQ